MNPSHQPFVYHIVDTREDKSIFYMHDSGYYFPEVWDYLKAQKSPPIFSASTLRSAMKTAALKSTHMGAPEVIRLRGELKRSVLTNKHALRDEPLSRTTVIFFYDELVELAAPHNIEISYDGMKRHFKLYLHAKSGDAPVFKGISASFFMTITGTSNIKTH